MRVSGHVPAFLRAQDVVLAGYDEIQHINQVLLNFLVDDKTDTRTLERFYLPAREGRRPRLRQQPVQDFIALLAERRTVVDPTLTTFNFIRQRGRRDVAGVCGRRRPRAAGRAARLPGGADEDPGRRHRWRVTRSRMPR